MQTANQGVSINQAETEALAHKNRKTARRVSGALQMSNRNATITAAVVVCCTVLIVGVFSVHAPVAAVVNVARDAMSQPLRGKGPFFYKASVGSVLYCREALLC